MAKCTFNLYRDERDHAPVACGDVAPERSAIRIGRHYRCTAHRNDLPAWAQYAIDETFGPSARIETWSPGDRDGTRYRVTDETGDNELTRYFLGRKAFLEALGMLHSAVTYRERVAREANRGNA
jgi:hypothetical protein